MTYTNPILLCDYSDPDVCRVGDDFYLTASSFNFVPGLPVLHSRDLVHWNLINYACPAIPLSGYDSVQNAKGIWAPSIRHHNGTFYIFFATPDEGIFCTTAKDPCGKWSELSCVWSGRGFEDPCPLWETDAHGNEHLYVVHAYVKSRIGFNSKLGLLEVDPVSLKAVSEDRFIFDGTKTQPTIEGPKFYRRNGFYYIFAPAGGVTDGWQTVLRSKRIDGGYEEKIVLAQGNSRINGPHQGGWVQTPAGEDWFIHFQDAGIFGRIVHLQPMRWVNDWPVMGTAVVLPDEEAVSVIGEPVEKWESPKTNATQEDIEKQTNFHEEINPLDFQFSANPSGKTYASTGNSLWLTPSVCTKKIDSPQFTYAKEFPLAESAFALWKEDERKGIIFLGNEYAALQISQKNDGGCRIDYINSTGSEKGDAERQENTVWSKEFPYSSSGECISFKMEFKAESDGKTGTVHFSVFKNNGTNSALLFESGPFKTSNAHWVGGRYGFF